MKDKLLLLLFSLSLVGLPTAVNAQSVEEAEAKNAAGRKAYDGGTFDEALALFKEAFGLHPSDRYLFNAAKACLRLKDSEGAVYFYERYLAFNPMASDRAKIHNEVDQLKERLRDRKLTEIRLVSNPSESKLSFEPARQTQVERTPGSVFLEKGSYTVRFQFEVYKDKVLKI